MIRDIRYDVCLEYRTLYRTRRAWLGRFMWRLYFLEYGPRVTLKMFVNYNHFMTIR